MELVIILVALGAHHHLEVIIMCMVVLVVDMVAIINTNKGKEEELEVLQWDQVREAKEVAPSHQVMEEIPSL